MIIKTDVHNASVYVHTHILSFNLVGTCLAILETGNILKSWGMKGLTGSCRFGVLDHNDIISSVSFNIYNNCHEV